MNAKEIGIFIGGLIAIVGMVIILPLLAVLIGWFAGFIIEFATGSYTTDGMNVLAGTDRFAKGDFARLTAIAAVIGTLFKGVSRSGGDKE